MQFAEVLSPEEVSSVRRFLPEHSSAARSLARKCQVISLNKTFEAAGYTTDTIGVLFKRTVHLPRLALSVPAARECEMHLGWSEGPNLTSYGNNRGSTVRPHVSWHTTAGEYYWKAKRPPLPIEARRAIDDHPETALVLWEASWTQHRQPSMALDDPAIIVPLIEDLYAVVYTWDLTEVERRALQKASGN